MPVLKLAKLPDRKPVKLTITILPELSRRLIEYSHRYKEVYGEDEEVVELIPYMLGQFLASDRRHEKVPRQGRSRPDTATA